MGIPSDRRRVIAASLRLCKRLPRLLPCLPGRSAFHKRRRRPAEAIEWLLGVFAGARTMAGLRERVLYALPLPCGLHHRHHRLGRASRSLVSYCA